jgi:hypothetical protein
MRKVTKIFLVMALIIILSLSGVGLYYTNKKWETEDEKRKNLHNANLYLISGFGLLIFTYFVYVQLELRN